MEFLHNLVITVKVNINRNKTIFFEIHDFQRLRIKVPEIS